MKAIRPLLFVVISLFWLPSYATPITSNNTLQIKNESMQNGVLHYQLHNTSLQPVAYWLKTLPTKMSLFTIEHAGTTCNVQGEQAILSAGSSCAITVKVQDRTQKIDFQKLFAVVADVPVVLPLKAKYHNMVVFGDSLSGISNRATNPSAAGKRLWDDDVAAVLIAEANMVVSSTLVADNNNLDAKQENVVYARGGNTTYNFAGQIDRYRTQLKGKTPDANTLVFVWLGGNDFRDPERWVHAPENVSKGIKELKALGIPAQQIYLINMPVLDEMPGYNRSAEKPLLHFSTKVYNTELALIAAVQGVHFINVYQFHQQVIANPAAYGFSNIVQSCQEAAVDKKECPGFMFYDGVHPSISGHMVLADEIMSHL